MRIAQVSPLYESVPPARYGGTERVVAYLTEALVQQGHEVTLFASGDSRTSARLIPCAPRSLRLDPDCIDPIARHVAMLEKVFQQAEAFDVIHFHVDYLHLPLARRSQVPYVTTLHGRLDLPDLKPLFRAFPEAPVISISCAQRTPLPWLNWQGTVYHGLPADLYRPAFEAGDYLVFLGRISPEKRLDRAIAIAERAGMPLKVAAKVDKADRAYFEAVIRPLLKAPHVEFIGEVDEAGKQALLAGAYALLFPIDWPEPFGMVMIEAMACGTPVIAFRRGSVPEVMEDRVTGFIVETVEEAAAVLPQVGSLDRRRIRQVFEARFTAERMARDYVAIYQGLLEGRYPPKAA